MTPKDGLEKYGIDNRFLSNIGITAFKSGGFRTKNSIKIYIPKLKLEVFQAFAIYLMIASAGENPDSKKRKNSISEWVLKQIENEIKELISSKNELYEEARRTLHDLKRIEYRKAMEETQS